MYTIPSSNDKISYTLASLINHDGDSLDCGHYISDVFDANTGIWWHWDDDNIIKIIDLPGGFYIRESHKKKEVMSGSTNVFFVVSIRTSHLKNTAPFFSRMNQHVQKQSYEESN